MLDTPSVDVPGRKILIVDDSRATQAILRRIVLRAIDDAATEIQAVDSATAALDLVPAFDPDLIITDWHMPQVSGLELVQSLRQLGHHRVRIGLVTAETHPDRLAEAHSNGVSFVLNKPFDDAALVSAVHAAFEAPVPAARGPVLTLPTDDDGPRFMLGSSPVTIIEQNGPITVDALQRLVGVAAKAVPHTVEGAEPMHFPQLSPFVLCCQFLQPHAGAEVLVLVDFVALCLLGAGAQGPREVQAAFNLGRPDPELVHRATTVLRVSAKLLRGHGPEAPWKLERSRILARALADPGDLLSKAHERTDVLVRAPGFGTGRLSFLLVPT